ncbi:hypothetical protein [Zoogloea sp.]|uniref:hypothetical protein n=1 Tax=Zoogloea sp. TaxID=49181 RepID=UPI0035AEA132
MLDAIVITIGIVGIAASLFYKCLLLAYRADRRAAAARGEEDLRPDEPGGR